MEQAAEDLLALNLTEAQLLKGTGDVPDAAGVGAVEEVDHGRVDVAGVVGLQLAQQQQRVAREVEPHTRRSGPGAGQHGRDAPRKGPLVAAEGDGTRLMADAQQDGRGGQAGAAGQLCALVGGIFLVQAGGNDNAGLQELLPDLEPQLNGEVTEACECGWGGGGRGSRPPVLVVAVVAVAADLELEPE